MIEGRIFTIESAFDSETLGSEHRALWSEAICLIELFSSRRWNDVYELGINLFSQARGAQDKAFILQWMVAATEIECDYRRRDRFLSFWSEIRDWAQDPYCSYLRAYHQGVTHFMACSLREAFSCFHQAYEIAREFGYGRGEMRSLFHLGLVEADRGNLTASLEYLRLAESQAIDRRASSYLRRILAKTSEITPEQKSDANEFVDGKKRIEKFILEKDFSGARETLLCLDRLRRTHGLGRRRESLGNYLGLIALGRGRHDLGYRLLAKITDQVLRVRILRLKAASLGLLKGEEREIEFLSQNIGISRVVMSGDDDVEVAGVRLKEIKDSAVRELILLMLRQAKPVDKEAIVRSVWKLEYDPVIHDRKVYKLIEKAKRVFGNADLFLNTYGAYQINPRLLGRISRAG